jgi:hypothetical protein
MNIDTASKLLEEQGLTACRIERQPGHVTEQAIIVLLDEVRKDARRAALEEAAGITKRLVSNVWGWEWGAAIASAIRALMDQEPQP